MQGVLDSSIVQLLHNAWQLAAVRCSLSVMEAVTILRHSKRTTLACWVSSSLLVASILAAAFYAEPEERGAILFCLGLVPSVAWLIVECHRAKHAVGPGGIRYRGLLHRYRVVPWRTLERTRWSTLTGCLCVYTSDGKVLRFSRLLEGLDALARGLAEHSPHVQVDLATWAMLAEVTGSRTPRTGS